MGLVDIPISSRVNTNTKTVFSTARGVLRIDDLVAHARNLAIAGVFAYPHLIDARQAHLKITPSDVHKLVTLNKELRRIHGIERTAFVTKNPADFGMMRMYESLIGEHDPGFAVFYEINHAREWILP